ncbi:hypothetical protein JCM10207_007024 [Rhodosporidiobolus poonsookiae]
MSEVPDTLVQLKYVVFSWPHNPLLKRDGLAKAWFRSHATMSTLIPALGGFPATIYEASTTNSVPELFLSQAQCTALINQLAEQMGPSRAQASFKAQAWRKRADLERTTPGGKVLARRFASQEELENRFAELKDGDDWAGTKQHWMELKRAQEVWQRLLAGAASGEMTPRVIAVDLETWESDHNLITEVGIASVRLKAGGTVEETAEHLIVAENADKRNGRYCPDARDLFQLGQSTTLPTASITAHLSSLFAPVPPPTPSYSAALSSASSRPPPTAPLLLLLHDPRGDLVSLAQLDLKMHVFERAPLLPAPASPSWTDLSAPSAFLLDTQRLYSGWTRRKKQAKLEDACSALGITLPGGSLIAHNAGNDAYFSLRLFLALMHQQIGDSADFMPWLQTAPPPLPTPPPPVPPA